MSFESITIVRGAQFRRNSRSVPEPKTVRRQRATVVAMVLAVLAASLMTSCGRTLGQIPRPKPGPITSPISQSLTGASSVEGSRALSRRADR